MGTLTIVPQAPRMGSERHGERGWKNVIDIYIFFKENRISHCRKKLKLVLLVAIPVALAHHPNGLVRRLLLG